MKKKETKPTERLLSRYPAMKNALANLIAQRQLVRQRLLREKALLARGDGTKEALVEQLLTWEELSCQIARLRAEMRRLERGLDALSDRDRRLLTAFFTPDYSSRTPFALMEQFGYEKSQLYHIRARALDQLKENLGEE